MSRVVLHRAALADGRSGTLHVGVSVAIAEGHIEWVRPCDDADLTDADIVDAGGATIVPAFVDGHSHLTLPGGSHWIERASDPPEVLKTVARQNARRLIQAGILWAIDVGAPQLNGRAVSLDIRDEMRGQIGQPYIRAAGTWIAKPGYLPLTVDANGNDLLSATLGQLSQGSDLVKVMLDPPPRGSDAPEPAFTADELRPAVDAVHARGARITVHSTNLAGARVAAEANVDSIQHGFQIDDDVATLMSRNKVALVTTLSVLASLMTFANTTRIDRFTSAAARKRISDRFDGARASVMAAKRAGVAIACGSDFGGGSVRAGHLAWEVELLVAAGLEPKDALAAATWRGGEVAGERTAGRIEAGMPADIVLVHGDPLSDPRALWRVWSVYQRGVRVA